MSAVGYGMIIRLALTELIVLISNCKKQSLLG